MKRKNNIRNILKYATVISIFLGIGCDQDEASKNLLLTEMVASPRVKVPTVPKVKASELYLEDLSAVKSELSSGVYGVSIGASPPPFTRFIELSICATESGKCVNHSTPFNRLTLNDLPTGLLEITAKACVEKKYSLDNETCGPTKSIRFSNPERFNPELDILYQQRWQTRESIDFYTKKLTDHLEIFEKEIKVCEKNAERNQNAVAMAQMTTIILAIGEKLINFGMKKFLADKKAVDEVDKAAKESIPASEGEKAAAETISKLDEPKEEIKKSAYPSGMLNSLESFIKSISLFGNELVPKDFALSTYWTKLVNFGNKPTSAFKYVGGSVFTLFNAQNLFVPRCLAEQRLKLTNAAAVENLKEDGERLRELNEAIIRLGGK